jgi:4-hydroxybenzoyl-CoA reductase subunit beta
MMRLPRFQYFAPGTAAEVARILADGPRDTMVVAGGTDILPNMKRRQQTPRVLVGLRNVAELKTITNGLGIAVGAGVTLSDIVQSATIRTEHTALWQAAAQVATPHLRNMGTIGGNLCLDTRCNYYDQNYEWRKAIDFCMKKDGETCWVAPSSKRCLAVSSTDTAPALIALDASVRLLSTSGDRTVKLEELYQNDGIEYSTRRPEELLTHVTIPDGRLKSCYWKLRRRGSFDFPVLGVAAALRFDGRSRVQHARIVLGAVASRPLVATKAAASLIGQALDDGAIAAAADAASEIAKPMDNTDFALGWRKKLVGAFVQFALRDLRGEDMRKVRAQYAHQSLECVL